MAATPRRGALTFRQRLPLLVAASLCLLSGCFGVTSNPSYFPHLCPFGDIIRTHAKPPGCGYWANFDKHACRIECRPIEATNPVGTQHVLIATIYDEKGEPRRNRRVEWMIEGVGNIIEVDESGFFPGRGYKVDNKYAVSYTDYCEHTFDRGNLDPCDDFTIRPGQSWCVISSAIEGDTHVCVYAPEIYNWDCHKVFVTKHWVDAEWRLPPPAVNRVGTQHTFTTQVFRHTDHRPLAGYRVRYKILDGPPAVFMPLRTQEELAVTDLNGNASVTLAQLEPRAGINRVGIEIIRAPDPTAPSGSGLIIGTGETRKEWQGPQVVLNKTVPAAVNLGQEVPYTITVQNAGVVDSQEMEVRDAIPANLEYLKSDPPASLDGQQLVWTLAGLPGGQAHTIQVVFRSKQPGPVNNTANVVTRDGLRDEKTATTQITVPQLAVKKTGPATGIVGQPINYDITVSNPGSGPATNVMLTDDFDTGLEHATKPSNNKLKLPVGTLAAGESKTVQLALTAKQAGRLVNRVEATADGNLSAKAEHPVDVQNAQLRIDLTGPSKRYMSRPADWKITVTNPGVAVLNNLVVRDQLPPELVFVSAGQGGTLVNGEVVWNLGTLQPSEQKIVQVKTNCAKMTPKALNVAVATSDPGLQVQAESPIEINGLPAFRLEVQDLSDPIEVGALTQYRIEVLNQGTLAGNQVQITATIPKQLKVTNANGPSQPRITAGEVVFPPVDSVPPGQKLNYTIEAQAMEPGDVRFRVKLTSSTSSDPVIEEESTNIYAAPATGTKPATPPAPPTSTPDAGAQSPAEPAATPTAPVSVGRPR